jgi:hypothetical protein
MQPQEATMNCCFHLRQSGWKVHSRVIRPWVPEEVNTLYSYQPPDDPARATDRSAYEDVSFLIFQQIVKVMKHHHKSACLDITGHYQYF